MRENTTAASCLGYLKLGVLHGKSTVTAFWMTISTQFILFSVGMDPIATPAADVSFCIFDHYSFIFCESESGTKLLHSMIYDIPSQQRMKNKLDFPTPFPDQLPQPPALPSFITPASLSGTSPAKHKHSGCVHSNQGLFKWWWPFTSDWQFSLEILLKYIQ